MADTRIPHITFNLQVCFLPKAPVRHFHQAARDRLWHTARLAFQVPLYKLIHYMFGLSIVRDRGTLSYMEAARTLQASIATNTNKYAHNIRLSRVQINCDSPV